MLEASVAKRLDEVSDTSYASLLDWAIALGLRLPPPFTFGAEYYGALVQPMLADGKLIWGETYEHTAGDQALARTIAAEVGRRLAEGRAKE